MVKSKQWILAQAFDGEPKLSDFKLEEEELSQTLKDGEIILEGIYHSVDPYMRAHKTETGSVMIGQQVAKVIESKSSKFPVGMLVQLYCGWRSHTLIDTANIPEEYRFHPVPPMGDISPSVSLGVLGMPGMTAYFGFLEICKPKEGETVLVNAAAGAVGSAVGQIAKIKGCKVIGFAGSKEKCDWVKSLGFDHVFNYKEVNLDDALKEAAPKGIDCYFDNVGGEFTATALRHMNTFGRISCCGAISTYNMGPKEKVTHTDIVIIGKQLKMEGFIVHRWLKQFPEGFSQMLKWIKEGKLKFKETVKDGFDNMPQVFMSLFKGDNIGKMVVKA